MCYLIIKRGLYLPSFLLERWWAMANYSENALIHSFGRKKLRTHHDVVDKDNVLDVLTEVIPDFRKNGRDHRVLNDNYRGKQNILNKFKNIRSNINHKIVNNYLYYIVEFKKGYVFGEEIQYIPRNPDIKESLDEITRELSLANKATVDKEVAEDMYIGGVGYKGIFPSKRSGRNIVVRSLSPINTGVVYSSDIEEVPLLAFHCIDVVPTIDQPTNNLEGSMLASREYTVYTDKHVYLIDEQNGELSIREGYPKPNGIGKIPIIEYTLNKSRLGLVELVLSQQDAINKLVSLEIDDTEQFVQSLLVFIDVEMDFEEYEKMLESGAVMLKTPETLQNAKPVVEAVSNKMQHSDAKVLHDKLYNDMLAVSGVPRVSDSGSSTGDTGQAKYVGEGWTLAEKRAKQDELSFIAGEREFIEVVLSIFGSLRDFDVEDVKARDIDVKFTRNRSDNLLVKTQSLENLQSVGLDPRTALELSELTNDPESVIDKMEEYYGFDAWTAAAGITDPEKETAEELVDDEQEKAKQDIPDDRVDAIHDDNLA